MRECIESEDKRYRYYLKDQWLQSLPLLCYIMLNPSTANVRDDDPTSTRCRSFASSLGCGGFVIVNLFAYRTPFPKDLIAAQRAKVNIVGEHDDANDCKIRRAIRESQIAVAAWGNGGFMFDRGAKVAKMLRSRGFALKCFGHNDNGQPKHPLYLPKDASLIPYDS